MPERIPPISRAHVEQRGHAAGGCRSHALGKERVDKVAVEQQRRAYGQTAADHQKPHIFAFEHVFQVALGRFRNRAAGQASGILMKRNHSAASMTYPAAITINAMPMVGNRPPKAKASVVPRPAPAP